MVSIQIMEYTAKTNLHDQDDKHSVSVRYYLSVQQYSFSSGHIDGKLPLSSKSTSNKRSTDKKELL